MLLYFSQLDVTKTSGIFSTLFQVKLGILCPLFSLYNPNLIQILSTLLLSTNRIQFILLLQKKLHSSKIRCADLSLFMTLHSYFMQVMIKQMLLFFFGSALLNSIIISSINRAKIGPLILLTLFFTRFSKARPQHLCVESSNLCLLESLHMLMLKILISQRCSRKNISYHAAWADCISLQILVEHKEKQCTLHVITIIDLARSFFEVTCLSNFFSLEALQLFDTYQLC